MKRSTVIIALLSAVAACLVTAGYVKWATRSFVEITVSSRNTTGAQLFFDTGYGFNEDESALAQDLPLSDNLHILRFAAPSAPVKAFRFDPFNGEGSLLIARVELRQGDGSSTPLTGLSIVAGNQIDGIDYSDAGITLTTTKGANDVFVIVQPEIPLQVSPGVRGVIKEAAGVMTGSFAACWLFLWLSINLHQRCLSQPLYLSFLEGSRAFIASGFALIAPLSRMITSIADATSRWKISRWLTGDDRRQLLLLSLALCLSITGARLLLLERFGSDLPWFDQWRVEGQHLYRRYFQGALTIGDFFEPCNEHRILFTRLLSLGILMVNGLWDNLLQTVINALIYAVTGVGLFWMVARNITGMARICWALAIAVAFSLPYGWENALWGFQSQFYLLVAFSLITIYLASRKVATTLPNLLLLVVVQLAALFTMGSGLIASAAAVGIYLLILVRTRDSREEHLWLWVKTAIALVVVVIGFKLLYQVSNHDGYKAHSLSAFFTVLAHCASWPWTGSTFWWLLNWLPWLAVTVMYLARKIEDRTWIRFIIALGGWVLMQEVATAYSRNTIALISKYADPIAQGVPVNCAAMIILYISLNNSWKKRIVLFSLLWIVVNTVFLAELTVANIKGNLPARAYVFRTQIEKTRRYLATGNTQELVPRRKYDIPMRDVEEYAAMLRDPIISHILPRSVNVAAVASGTPKAVLSRLSDHLLAGSAAMAGGGTLLLAILSIVTTLRFISVKRGNDE